MQWMRTCRWMLLMPVLFLLFRLPAGEPTVYRERTPLEEQLIAAWTDGEKEIVLPASMPLARLEACYFALLDAEPGVFWVAHRFGYTADAYGVCVIFPEYLCPAEEISVLRVRLANALASLSAVIPRGASDYAAAYALHDALAAVTVYGTPEASPLGAESAYTAYGALSDRRAVCRGYAMAYLLLLREAGIDASYISSDAMAHGWVLAELDGRRLHIDVTWDDAGKLSHRYFARTETAMTAMGYTGWTFEKES